MLDKKVSVSAQVANLSRDAQLLFTWSIPHADDVGMLTYSHRSLKALVVPMITCTDAEFAAWVDEIVRQGLWAEFVFKDPIGGKEERYYRIVKFADHQTLKRDRNPQTILPVPMAKSAKTSWNTLQKALEANGFHLETTDFHLETEEKRREEKRSEDKGSEERPESTLSYLENIPEVDMKTFTDRFVVSPGGVRSKAEDLKLYCQRKRKTYANYRAFLLNALKRDFKERQPEDVKQGKYSGL